MTAQFSTYLKYAVKLGSWQGPQKKQGYWEWKVETPTRDESGSYFEGFVDANSSDEQSSQNVNWEVAKNGSPIKRGFADNVRAAKSQVEQFVRGL